KGFEWECHIDDSPKYTFTLNEEEEQHPISTLRTKDEYEFLGPVTLSENSTVVVHVSASGKTGTWRIMEGCFAPQGNLVLDFGMQFLNPEGFFFNLDETFQTECWEKNAVFESVE